jgi:PKD repeat protein
VSKKLLAVIIVVIMAVAGTLVFLMPYLPDCDPSPDPREKGLAPVITFDKQLIRINEDINFSAEGSKGPIAEYEWSIGNDTIGNNEDINHTFIEAGWYKVDLTIWSKKGKNATSSVMVGVQRPDMSRQAIYGRHGDWRLIWKSGSGMLVDVGPNIGYPTVEVSATVNNAIGKIGFELAAVNDTTWDTIYEESTIAAGSVSFTHTLQSQDFTENTTSLFCILWVDEGRHGGFVMDVDAVYPFDDLALPNDEVTEESLSGTPGP